MLQRPIEPTQYVSIVYNERLLDAGISASTGTVGDSYDNALAENVNGSYKNEGTAEGLVDIRVASRVWSTEGC